MENKGIFDKLLILGIGGFSYMKKNLKKFLKEIEKEGEKHEDKVEEIKSKMDKIKGKCRDTVNKLKKKISDRINKVCSEEEK